MTYEAILYDKHEHVAVLTLNRPERLNAISGAVREEVHAGVQAAQDDDDVRALIITGEGRGFCSGADLSGGPPAGGGELSQNTRLDEDGWVGRWARRFARFDKPLIGAINGVAAGAGMSMALACDLRVGSEHSRFKAVFIERSLSPDSGLSYFLPRVVGYSRAADILMTSRAVNAEEAYRIGLLDRLVPHAALVEEFDQARQRDDRLAAAGAAHDQARAAAQRRLRLRGSDPLRVGRAWVRPQGPQRRARVEACVYRKAQAQVHRGLTW